AFVMDSVLEEALWNVRRDTRPSRSFLNIKEGRGFTALHFAVSNGYNQVVSHLLEMGADPNIRANDGFTAIMTARYQGNEIFVNLLSEHGATITELDENAKLEGRVLGVHFYNPPAVQRLVEIIRAKNTKDEVVEYATSFVKNLRKITVPSNDFAGFIGNGHFMRDALYAMGEVDKLSKEMSFVEAVYTMNKISQEYLIRPMGIFQLIDYVGIDVCQYIMSVMDPKLPDEDLHSPLLDKLISLGVYGGQTSSGAQKDGFLKYEKGTPVAIYDPDKKGYVEIKNFKAKCDDKLGPIPSAVKPWRAIIADPSKDQLIQKAFDEIKSSKTLGGTLATEYARRSKEIGLKLVTDKVANNEKDVNTVMLTGFYHAYGPINNYLNS
ncbi:3-hydroxyacyl-CoA dehydrogenase NAD-binding domain-containing protein, partial [Bdellovibrionota bacterium]